MSKPRFICWYCGYRLYCDKEPTHKETIIQKDGNTYRVTEFIPGHYFAVHLTRGRIEGTGRDIITTRIEVEYSKAKFE